MRLTYNFFGILLLLASAGWGQQTNGPMDAARLRRQRMMQQRQQRQQQNPGDFAPDPAPIQPQATPSVDPPKAQPTPQASASPSPASMTPPEQLPPATPPQVTYRDGLLTVVATNSNLSSVLSAIRNKAGVQFDGLEGGSAERVAITMGPAPAAEVLTAILGGSNFDYIILERPDSPGIVQKVMLTPKGGSVSAKAGQLARNPDADADDEEEAAEEPAAPQDTPIRPPIAQLPQQQPPPNPEAQQPSRTAEQMLEEIKRRAAAQQPQPTQNAPVKPSPPQF